MAITLNSLGSALHTDLCPGLNRYVYWMKNPVWLLFLSAACCFFSGVFVNPALHVVGGLVLLVIAAGWLWPAATMRLLSCELSFERSRCREEETVVARLTVHNRSWLPAWGLTISRGFLSELEANRNSHSDSPLAALGRVPARTTSEFHWEFRPTRRGVYPQELPLLETRFPFGLSSATTTIACRGSLIVWPAVVPLGATPESLTLNGREDRLSDRRSGDFGDVIGTRSFRQGDSLRRIHWSQSARLDQFVVCEHQAACTHTVTLHPDLRVTSHQESDDESLERTLKITASLVHHFFRSGVGCVVTLGREQRSVPAGHVAAYRKVMDDLAKTPVEGLKNVGALRTRSDTDLVITTDQAHQTGPARTIVLESDAENCEACRTERIFCRVPPRSRLDEFPGLWRRACGVA